MIDRRPGLMVSMQYPVVKALVRHPLGFEMSDNFCLFGKQCNDRTLRRINNVVSLTYGNLAIDLQMKFDKDAVARVPRAKIMYATHAGTCDYDLFDALALLLWQLVIQKLTRCGLCDATRARDHEAHDDQRKCRIRPFPSGRACQRQCSEDGPIQYCIHEIVRPIRGDGG